jgi:hypothetical protein
MSGISSHGSRSDEAIHGCTSQVHGHSASFLGQVDVIHRELTFSKVIFLMIKGDFKS